MDGLGLSWPAQVTLSAKIHARCKMIRERRKKKLSNTRTKLAISATGGSWSGKVARVSLSWPAKTIRVAATLDPLALGLPVHKRSATGNWWNERPNVGKDFTAALVIPSADLSPGHDRLTKVVPPAAMLTWWSGAARGKNTWLARRKRVDIRRIPSLHDN